MPNFAVSQHQFTIKLSQAHPILDFNSNHLLEKISNFSTPVFDDFGETTIMTQHLSSNITASYFQYRTFASCRYPSNEVNFIEQILDPTLCNSYYFTKFQEILSFIKECYNIKIPTQIFNSNIPLHSYLHPHILLYSTYVYLGKFRRRKFCRKRFCISFRADAASFNAACGQIVVAPVVIGAVCLGASIVSLTVSDLVKHSQ